MSDEAVGAEFEIDFTAGASVRAVFHRKDGTLVITLTAPGRRVVGKFQGAEFVAAFMDALDKLDAENPLPRTGNPTDKAN